MNGPSNYWGMQKEINQLANNIYLYIQSDWHMRDRNLGFSDVFDYCNDIIAQEVRDVENVDWLDLARILPKAELDESAESISAFFDCDGHHGFFEHCYSLDECIEFNAMAWFLDQVYEETLQLISERYAKTNQKQTRI